MGCSAAEGAACSSVDGAGSGLVVSAGTVCAIFGSGALSVVFGVGAAANRSSRLMGFVLFSMFIRVPPSFFCNKKGHTIPVKDSCGLICLTGFKVLGTAQGQKSAWTGCVDMDLL